MQFLEIFNAQIYYPIDVNLDSSNLYFNFSSTLVLYFTLGMKNCLKSKIKVYILVREITVFLFKILKHNMEGDTIHECKISNYLNFILFLNIVNKCFVTKKKKDKSLRISEYMLTFCK